MHCSQVQLETRQHRIDYHFVILIALALGSCFIKRTQRFKGVLVAIEFSQSFKHLILKMAFQFDHFNDHLEFSDKQNLVDHKM